MTDRQTYADLADALRIPCNAWPWRPALAKSFRWCIPASSLLLTLEAVGLIISADACRASDDTILSIYLQEAMAQVKHSMPALRANISSLTAR